LSNIQYFKSEKKTPLSIRLKREEFFTASLCFSDFDDAVDRADGHASGFIVVADAVNAYAFIDDIEVIAWCDGADRAFGLACSAVGAFVCNSMCHGGSFGLLFMVALFQGKSLS